MQRKILTLQLIAVLCVSACDPVWIKERTINLQTTNPGDCIMQALEGVPEIYADKDNSNSLLFNLRRVGDPSSPPLATININKNPVAKRAVQLIFVIPPRGSYEDITTILDDVDKQIDITCRSVGAQQGATVDAQTATRFGHN